MSEIPPSLPIHNGNFGFQGASENMPFNVQLRPEPVRPVVKYQYNQKPVQAFPETIRYDKQGNAVQSSSQGSLVNLKV